MHSIYFSQEGTDQRISNGVLGIVLATHVGILSCLWLSQNRAPELIEHPILVNLLVQEPATDALKPEVSPPQNIKPVIKKVLPQRTARPIANPEPRMVAPAPVAQMESAQVAQTSKIEPSKTEASPVPQPDAVSAKQAEEKPLETAQQEAIEPPRFNADYLDNPAPGYPPLSRKLGEQGRVLLRVYVNASGAPSQVVLHKSSGYLRLDEVAADTVRRWKFVSARQGSQPVDAWVIVPIQFNLKG